ncbi:hypothetical protein BGZ90_002673 [Linnemannia elongata]|nr:hypothetical protein BGZ90_002673 [Linnemannia elongata]
MDGVAFQGMPRIALTPAEEAQIPRPHSSASQVATAVPSAYSRTTSPPPPPLLPSASSSSSRHPHSRNQHSAIAYHPYLTNNLSTTGSLAGLGAHLASPSSTSIPYSDSYYSRPSSPGPRPSSPSILFQHHTISAPSPSTPSNLGSNKTTGASTEEQEYPQNPQESYYSPIPPRSASPGPSRLAFALGHRPARSPSPQLYSNNNLYDHYQPRSSYFHRNSHDAHPRPGSPLNQEHQDSWDSNHRVHQRVDSPNAAIDSDEEDSESGNDSDNPRRTPQYLHRPVTPQRSNSKSILSRLRETTSRLSLGDDYRRPSRASQESNQRGDSGGPQTTRDSQDSSASRPGESGGKEVLQDLSDEERAQEPRKSRSGWRPSLSLIRQESSTGSYGNSNNLYLQNNPNRISDMLPSMDPNYDSHNNPNSHDGSNGQTKKNSRKKNSKASKKKRRRQKKRRAERLAALQKQQQLYDQQLAEQALYLPELPEVLDKKTRYPLSYDDFEAFLRSQRAVEYLNFWTDVTAHERLCRTFDVSERRQKREQQLEERAIARDKRRVALMAAMESGRITPDPELMTQGFGVGTGIGIGASGQDIEGSNLYSASRSSLQLPLNDHLSFPQESRRYGIQDSSAPFPPAPPSHSGYFQGVAVGDTYNRQSTGAGTDRTSNEMSRPSLEEAHISEQDAAVAAVAMRAQRNGLMPTSQSREDTRRSSFDYYRPLPGGTTGGSALSSPRYLQNNNSNGYVGGPLTSSYSAPNAYNLLMRGRGSVDVMARSNSRNSRTRPAAAEDYFGNGIRRVTSQNFQSPQTPPQHSHYHQQQEEGGMPSAMSQPDQEVLQDEQPTGDNRPQHPGLRRQESQLSIAFTEPDFHRRPSLARYGGTGPLQASPMIRRSGESAYAPSLYSMGTEGRALLVQSFRTIGLEDVQESALRIYRKYLIQLRTASMAAEEEAAAFAAAKENNDGRKDGLSRPSLEKSFAPGWDGYAEEVIAQWNEKWKGRSREARRSRRLAGGRRTYSGRSADGDNSGQPSTVGDDDGPQDHADDVGQGHGLKINTQSKAPTPEHGHRKGERGDRSDEDNIDPRDDDDDHYEDDDHEDEEHDDIELGTTRRRREKSSAPSSPVSPRMRKRTGTGLSALLNPLLTRLMRTETTVVELPTLTINTTTIEEAAVLDDSEEDDSEDDDEEDEDSDDEDEEDDEEEENDNDQNDGPNEKVSIRRLQPRQKIPVITKESPPSSLRSKQEVEVEEVVVEEVLDRSMPTAAHVSPQSLGTESDQSQGYASDTEAPDGLRATAASEPSDLPDANEPSRKNSISSSLSSSWDQITKKDLQKQVTILPPPATSSTRITPYHRQGLRGVRMGTKRAAKSATKTAHNVSLQLSTFWSRNLRQDSGSSSSSLDVIQVTPTTPRIDFQFQIPAIVMDSPSSNDKSGSLRNQSSEKVGGLSPLSASVASSPIVPLQNVVAAGQASAASDLAHDLNEKSSLHPPSQPFGTPGGLSTTPSKLSTAPASPQSSIGQASTGVPRTHFIGSSPAAVAASAAAAAFYLPLECRQRIHTQVQEEGRTEAPYLYGPAKGFVMDVVLQDHYYPLFLKYVVQQNLGLLTRHHPNNVLKRSGMIWSGIVIWLVVLAVQLTLVLIGQGGWKSPWVYLVGTVGGWTGSICLATGVKRFSPLLGIAGKICEDKHLFRFRKVLEPSIRIRHRLRAYWMLTYCFFWSTVIMVIFAALPQKTTSE